MLRLSASPICTPAHVPRDCHRPPVGGPRRALAHRLASMQGTFCSITDDMECITSAPSAWARSRSMNSVHHPSQNHLLAELQEAEFGRLSPYLELVRMSRGEVLYQSGSNMTHLYFPTTAIISIDYILENGGTSEIASVGNEGLVGIALFMGGRSTPNRALVQTLGHAYRLRAARLLDEFYRKGPVLRLLLRYTQALMTQMAQAAVCNGHHSTEQRLCRWLLQALDRSNGSAILGTQENIAAILGVRREGVTDAARRLQIMGLISYRRGHVTVLNRPGLEHLSCECYGVLRRESLRLLPDIRPRKPAIDRPWRQRGEPATRRLGNGDRRSAQQDGADVVVAGDTQTAYQTDCP